MADFTSLPQYRCHKIVRAARIKLVEASDAEGWWVHLDLPGDRVVSAEEGLFSRGMPVRGDYLVVYDDGYVSWSPAKAFEDGYSPLKPTIEGLEALLREEPDGGAIVHPDGSVTRP